MLVSANAVLNEQQELLFLEKKVLFSAVWAAGLLAKIILKQRVLFEYARNADTTRPKLRRY